MRRERPEPAIWNRAFVLADPALGTVVPSGDPDAVAVAILDQDAAVVPLTVPALYPFDLTLHVSGTVGPDGTITRTS